MRATIFSLRKIVLKRPAHSVVMAAQMKASMKTTLLGLGLAVTVIPVAVMFAFIKLMGADVVRAATSEFRGASVENAKRATLDMRRMCEIVRTGETNASDAARAAILAAFAELGEPSLSKAASDIPTRVPGNPDSESIKRIRLLKFGKFTADPNMPDDDPQNAVARAVNRLKDRLRCEMAVYVKTDDGLVALAGTGPASDGKRAAGAVIPASDDSPARVSIFRSGADASRSMDANYIPLASPDGEIIGGIYFGLRRTSAAELEDYFKALKIGGTGIVWVVDDSDGRNPVIRISGDSSAVGVPVADDNIRARADFFLKALAKAKTLRGSEVAVDSLSLPMGQAGEAARLVTYAYYKPWNWLVGTMTDEREFQAGRADLAGQTDTLTRKIVLAGAIFAATAIGIAWIMASRMSRTIRALARVANYQSRGDIAAAEKILWGKSSVVAEFDELFKAVLLMARSLTRLISALKLRGEDVAERAGRISETSDTLDVIASEEAASTKNAASTGSKILGASEALNKNARGSAFEVSRTLDIARESGESLRLLKNNYDALTAASENVAGKLAVINGNVEKITGIVTTINEVSRQTNLLSLNASIEAEKAGEFGLGFAVVARQIRRLADKTSVASANIENIVRQMQSSVNSGVMEMDRFGAKMRQSSKIIMETADMLARTVSDIEAIGPQFEGIASGIGELSENARRISATMLELSDSSVRARDRISEFRAAVKSLDAVSVSVLEAVARFKIDGGGGAK